MKKMLGTFVLVVALLAPSQMVLAAEYDEELEMTYQIMGRMSQTQMKLSKASMKLMKNRSKMSHAKMTRIMNEIDSIERQIQRLIEIGDE